MCNVFMWGYLKSRVYEAKSHTLHGLTHQESVELTEIFWNVQAILSC